MANGSLPPFARRHIGPSATEQADMLDVLGCDSLEDLVHQTIPASLRMEGGLVLPDPLSESEALEALAAMAGKNDVWRSYLGYGYHNTHTPTVILRNVVENPGWYTAYTPYQAEISQGRMEALLVYQTVVQELTGFTIANASMLDDATAAAEAMTLCHRVAKKKQGDTYIVSPDVHPHILSVVQTRAEPLGIRVVVQDPTTVDWSTEIFGVLLSYPGTDGGIPDIAPLCEAAHEVKAKVTVCTDLLALCVLPSPGSLGADIAVGNSQRFGVPLGYGGPHAGFMATEEGLKRQLPGRIIGISHDSHGLPALRMALQTREQHIRRQRATSNICTAQVLLAVVAGLYAAWHGPEGLRAIADRVHASAVRLASAARSGGHTVLRDRFFDSVAIRTGDADATLAAAAAKHINLRRLDDTTVLVALDETVTEADLADLADIFGSTLPAEASGDALSSRRTKPLLQQPVFHSHRSETEMLRWLHRMESKDLALNTSMIPLGSCTMKLNATTEMIPVTWPGFNALHPFAPTEQALGYREMFDDLQAWLSHITGFAAVSLQPNAGSQGEYAGLLTIRAYHRANGEAHRNICLIPMSAHGTNPASAVMAGMKVVVVDCDDDGNIDVADLSAKAAEAGGDLAALMVTYPSTHGVFEEAIKEICGIVHGHGGQVYMDGANMNAMVGLCRPGDFGADVCHLNLHKTFCIPHGGGGPGMGPIGVAAHLVPHLPGHEVVAMGEGTEGNGAVSAAPWGSPSILPITWAYIAMLGGEGLTRATEVAILNANYIAKRLEGAYDVLYRGASGRVAHECILDTRGFKADGVQVDDLAKRLMDYGFHAPTMSFPVVGTLMVEPTESECRAELDRFCDAMLAIRAEVQAVQAGEVAVEDSALRHSPHTMHDVTRDDWDRPYSRSDAAFPMPWQRAHKYWPTVGRIDNAAGDRNLICTCDAWPDS